MKTKFTVANGNEECTLGEYMLMKANAPAQPKTAQKSNLPVAKNFNAPVAITAFVSYVNEKLAVKKPPVREKVIKKFPFRTSAAAFLSALVACTLMISYGVFAINSSYTLPTVETEQTETEETYKTSEAPQS
jgi:hypothetical protein